MMKRSAFTLIELLIVVAIIAILAAIAVPNFLEAQTRAKVSRAKADLRTSATALESYYVDSNAYPTAAQVISALTTPIAYLTNASTRDPFGVGRPIPPFPPDVYAYTNLNEDRWIMNIPLLVPGQGAQRILGLNWINISRGPDNDLEIEDPNAGFQATPVSLGIFFNGIITSNSYYDPTNGTVSNGDIIIGQGGFLPRG